MNYHIDIQSDRLSVSDTDRNINMQTVMQTCNMIIMIMIYTEGPQLAEAVFSEATSNQNQTEIRVQKQLDSDTDGQIYRMTDRQKKMKIYNQS